MTTATEHGVTCPHCDRWHDPYTFNVALIERGFRDVACHGCGKLMKVYVEVKRIYHASTVRRAPMDGCGLSEQTELSERPS